MGLYQLCNMFCPGIKRSLPRGEILAAIIDPCDAADLAGAVIEDPIDHLLANPELRHPGCSAAAQIVDREMRHSRHLGQDLLPCVAKSSRRPIGQDREEKPASPW